MDRSGLTIALDPWVLARRFRKQGIYVYAQQLFREFGRMAPKGEVSFCLFTTPGSSNDAAVIGAAQNFTLERTALLKCSPVWRLAGASLAARNRADLLFAPSATVVPCRIPVVSTIHDVTPVLMPSHPANVNAVQRFFLWRAALASRAIITVSECSKKDLMNVYGIPEEKISVVYLGCNRMFFNDAPADAQKLSALKSKLGVRAPYIIHHGTIQQRKNLVRLVEAYRLMLTENPFLDFDLVLAGAPGWGYEDVFRAAQKQGQRRVLFAGALEDEELALLVKGASLAVIPSLYEGFCLPMLECMACGTPTIAANASCLPEISGGVLKYFDPVSIEDMAVCMKQAIEDTQLRGELTRRGKQRAGSFDWVRCAEETLRVLQRAAVT
ncbi:MAG: glycosyltransferase family 4 protein [Candidatus Angelobacter sp.]